MHKGLGMIQNPYTNALLGSLHQNAQQSAYSQQIQDLIANAKGQETYNDTAILLLIEAELPLA